MKGFLIIIFVLFFQSAARCQKKPIYSDSTVLSIDTVEAGDNEYKLIHYHIVSRLNERKISLDTKDSIFDDRFNQFSRLVFYENGSSFNVPTIPLTHVIYLKHPGLILGLSNFSNSPYHIVIYSIKGELLHKAALLPLELKVNKSELKQLLKKHPMMDTCLSQMVIVKENDSFYLEMNPCLRNILNFDSISKMGIVRPNHYFPYMGSPTREDLYPTQLSDFFSGSDPVYDLITIGSTPYLLILNSERGTKVNIPLISNCNIIKELTR